MASRSLRYRSLLTDTLPYEVPVIFSNNLLHSSLSAPPSDAKATAALGLLRGMQKTYSKPYSYEISKGEGRVTTLGVIHPLWQISISEFYEDHAASILTYCADERFSLRRPAAVASPFAEAEQDDAEGRLKLGVAQAASDAGEPDVSHLTTYFAYRKYNLLGKFADSREHQRLETRFTYRRSLDVSKCFYNIYTHSVTWAIKGKSYAKSHANQYTFEGLLDTLFQKVNYNETNGIVVGPEFSRIFAEIILQRIDRNVSTRLADRGLEATKDYDIRRYVDDFYIFSNSLECLDAVEAVLSSALEEFKLYLNDGKRETHTRPFVSDISLARYEIEALVREVWRTLREIDGLNVVARAPGLMRTVRLLLGDVRFAIRNHNVRFENVSGWLLGKYRVIARAVLRNGEGKPELQAFVAEAILALTEASLYVCAVDTRVRTTYSLAQLIELIDDNRDYFSEHQIDEIEHAVNEGIVGIVRTIWSNKSRRSRDSVELYNLLISGVALLGADFISQTLISEVLTSLADEKPKYFRYIAVKYCMLRDRARFQSGLDRLNDAVEAHLRGAGDWKLNAEDFLLLSDFLSAPDVTTARKRNLFAKVVGSEPSKATIELIVPHVGFVDWTGLSVRHLLRRKTLRPVYAWA